MLVPGNTGAESPCLHDDPLVALLERAARLAEPRFPGIGSPKPLLGARRFGKALTERSIIRRRSTDKSGKGAI
jgi:hypothetical protein